MIKDRGEFNIYKIETPNKINKKKVLIPIMCIGILICLIIIIKNSITIMNGHKVYKQYEAQLQSINFQEKEKQAKKEAEEKRIKEERLPKLTQTRKTKY